MNKTNPNFDQRFKLFTDKMYYLASPYTHKLDSVEAARAKEITEIAGKLIVKYNLKLMTPITASYHIVMHTPELRGDWDTWKELDFMFMDRCDGMLIAMMDGWRQSVGVTAELEYAHKIKLPVWYFNPESLDQEVTDALHKS